MEADLHFDLPLHRSPARWSLLCLVLGAYMSAAETAITGASRPRMHRLAQQGNKRAALVNGLLDRKDEAVSAVLLGNSVVNILSASLTTAVLTAALRRGGHRLRHGDRRHHGGDLRRGDAQDLGAAARRPGGAGPGAVDRRHPGDPGPDGARRRLDLAHLPAADRRAHRPQARDRRTCRRAARRHRAARRRPVRRGRAGREGDAALGARPRRPHGGRRHDPSRQRRPDRRRPADGRDRRPRCWRRPTRASRSIAASPTTSSASSMPRTCSGPSRPPAVRRRSRSTTS